MRTEKQSAASRQNGAQSRGPATEEGKRKSSENSTRYGFHSAGPVIAGENPEEFKKLLDLYLEDFRPDTPVETDLVKRMATCRWRLIRIERLEAALYDNGLAEGEALDDAAALRKMDENSATLDYLSRHENRLDRAWHKAFASFRELRKIHDDEIPQSIEVKWVDPQEKKVKNEPEPPAPPVPPRPSEPNPPEARTAPANPPPGRPQPATRQADPLRPGHPPGQSSATKPDRPCV